MSHFPNWYVFACVWLVTLCLGGMLLLWLWARLIYPLAATISLLTMQCVFLWRTGTLRDAIWSEFPLQVWRTFVMFSRDMPTGLEGQSKKYPDRRFAWRGVFRWELT